jgi:hypothetical protein
MGGVPARDLLRALVVLVWVPLVLVADVGVGLGTQRALGVGTWVLLIMLLRSESGHTRAQVAVVVAYATVVEYTCSPLLGVYTYRLHNVPAFVPPGHGLVYLAALVIGRSGVLARFGRLPVVAVLVGGGGYALWGLGWSPRLDVLGALWFGCLALWLVRGRAPLVYVGAFVVVTYLELLGTAIGTWTWSTYDPTGLIAIGNPPSGAAGGYGFFDAAAMALAPTVEVAARRLRARLSTDRSRAPAQVSSSSAASQASLR